MGDVPRILCNVSVLYVFNAAEVEVRVRVFNATSGSFLIHDLSLGL